MTDSQTAPSAARFELRTMSDSHFSWVRTRLNLERTMMSWLRTAGRADRFRLRHRPVSQAFTTDPRSPLRLSSNRTGVFGLALISCGVLALVISIWQYRWTVRYL